MARSLHTLCLEYFKLTTFVKGSALTEPDSSVLTFTNLEDESLRLLMV